MKVGDTKRAYGSRKTDSKGGSYTLRNTSANGSGYRSAKTGRYVASNAPRIKSAKKRSAAVGRATTRVKTAVTVDLLRSRRSR